MKTSKMLFPIVAMAAIGAFAPMASAVVDQTGTITELIPETVNGGILSVMIRGSGEENKS